MHDKENKLITDLLTELNSHENVFATPTNYEPEIAVHYTGGQIYYIGTAIIKNVHDKILDVIPYGTLIWIKEFIKKTNGNILYVFEDVSGDKILLKIDSKIIDKLFIKNKTINDFYSNNSSDSVYPICMYVIGVMRKHHKSEIVFATLKSHLAETFNLF